MKTPVVLDFWAPWCGPCKTLGPMLEKLEQQYGGRFLLVKVDTDAEQELAQHFRIRSIPTVFAFVNGQPVDQFQGALPEGQLREFLDRLMPNPAESLLQDALHAIEAGDTAAAAEHLKKALAADPANDSAHLMYAQLLLQDDDPGAASAQLDQLSTEARADPQVQTLIESVKQRLAAGIEPAPPALLARVEAAPADLQARIDLAQHYTGQKQWALALEQLLEVVRRDRAFGEDIGRKSMLQVFELASAQPELVAEWRRRLSSVLF